MSGRGAADVTVATVTLVRDPAEEVLLRRALTRLAGHGRPLFVCDGGSGDSFVEFLRALPDVTVVTPEGTGLVGQVRSSVSAASRTGDGFVLYTEPDKEAFFAECLGAFISTSLQAEGAGIVLAARSSGALASFPPIQQRAESIINGLCADFLGGPGDYSYGPFLLRADLAPCLAALSDGLGWGWRHFVFAAAHRLEKPIVHVVGDFCCPPDQRAEGDEERIHRLRQLAQNVNGLLAGLTVDLTH